MNLKIAPKIWFDGKFIDWQEAKVSILSHSLQRGSAIFENMAFYKTTNSPAIFRIENHAMRFFESAELTKMSLPLGIDAFKRAIVDTVLKSKFEEGGIRPLAFYKEPAAWLTPTKERPSVAIAVFQVPPAPKVGQCKITSFRKKANPLLKAKVSGNYMLARLAKIEAQKEGFNESVFFDEARELLEGPTANVFMVKKGLIFTPPAKGIMEGITRDSAIRLAKDLGFKVRQKPIKRQEFLRAAEVFMTSTSIRVLPMIKVDKKLINKGRPGPITKILREAFEEVVHGRNKKYFKWLTFAQ